jgi:hypothetical protein
MASIRNITTTERCRVGVVDMIPPSNLSAGSMFCIGPDLGSNLLLCFTIRPVKRLLSAFTGGFELYISHRDHQEHPRPNRTNDI